jgi:hypothetical protein
MRTGGWFVRPMLRQEDSLADIVAADARFLEGMGLTSAQLGIQLAELLASAPKTDWFRPLRFRGMDVELHRRRGLITCPWAPGEFVPCEHGGGFRPTANEFLIRNSETGRALKGLALSIHLIREHGFFGGPGTGFRLEPAEVAEALAGHV